MDEEKKPKRGIDYIKEAVEGAFAGKRFTYELGRPPDDTIYTIVGLCDPDYCSGYGRFQIVSEDGKRVRELDLDDFKYLVEVEDNGETKDESKEAPE
jgi:hypothetical protein